MFRSNITALAGYKPGEQPQVGKFIKLNTNENPYPPSPAVALAIGEAAKNLSRYPDPFGTAFRQQAAEVYGVSPDWILCGNGSDDILTILTRAFVGEGDRLRLPYPSYILYRTLAEIQGANWEEISFDNEWNLPSNFGESAERLKLAFLPNPNSPSGTVLAKDVIRDLAKSLPCPLLVDEAYADFADDNCIDLVRENENVMVSRTMSKSYGLAGLRFGFLIAQPQIIAELEKVKDSYNCDALSIAGATAAIADQAWLSNNRAKVIATRERLTAGMRELGFTVCDSQANFVWCTRSEPVKPLYDALKEQRVLVRYMNYPNWKDPSSGNGEGLRISVGDDGQNEACLALLKTIIEESS